MKIWSIRGGQLLPAPRAVGGDVNAGAAKRQAGAPDFLAEISLAGARVHDVGTRRIDEQRVDRDVRQAVARRAPGRAVVVTLPDASRHASRKNRRRNRRVKL